MQNTWIFQLGGAPTAEQSQDILSALDAYMATWKAHGAPVPGRARLAHDRFIIVVAEPGHASGCSIDAMTRAVSDILARHGMSLLGPEHIFYRDAQGSLAVIDFKEVRAAVADGRLQAETTVYDSTLSQSNDIERWEVPLSQTWMARFLAVKA